MWTFLSNPGIQLILVFVVAGFVVGLAAFVSVRALIKLKTKTKSISEIAKDGERIKKHLERYTGKLSDDV